MLLMYDGKYGGGGGGAIPISNRGHISRRPVVIQVVPFVTEGRGRENERERERTGE
jgi:hypothetical protein